MPVVSVEARVVYASGARVRRVTTISAALPGRVRIVGLPLAVIAAAVRVGVEAADQLAAESHRGVSGV